MVYIHTQLIGYGTVVFCNLAHLRLHMHIYTVHVLHNGGPAVKCTASHSSDVYSNCISDVYHEKFSYRISWLLIYIHD